MRHRLVAGAALLLAALVAPGLARASMSVSGHITGSTTWSITGSVRWSRGASSDQNLSISGGTPSGTFTYTGDGKTFTLTRVDAIVITGHDAVLFGVAGSTTLRVDFHDAGNPGTGDTLRVRTPSYDSGTLTRVTGNLTIH